MGIMRWLCVVCVVMLLSACNSPIQSLYPPSLSTASSQPDSDLAVYVTSNHWHAGFVLRLADMPESVRSKFAAFHEYPYVEVGWGSDIYYRAKEPNILTGLCAAFCSPRGVMHVVGITPDPEEHYGNRRCELYRVRVSRAGYDALLKYVCEMFDVGADGTPQKVQDGLYAFSQFYRAHGAYFVLHTCNHWTADGLRKTGFPITPMYAFTADNLCEQIREEGIKFQADIVVQRE